MELKDHGGSHRYRKIQLDYQGIINAFNGQKENFNDKDIQYIEKAICLLMLGEYGKAANELKKLTKGDISNDFYYLLIGLAKEKSADFKQAFSNYDKCLALNNKNVEAYKRRGLLHQGNGELDAAMNDFNAMYEIAPQSSEALKYRGISEMLNEKYGLALADFDEYEQRFDNDSDIFFNKGHCLNQLGKLADAVVSFKKALSLNPKDYEVIFEIAQNNYTLGNREESLLMCDSILNSLDCHVMATNLKGVIQMDLKNFEAAIFTFKSGTACSPYYEDFHINKAIALIGLGNNKDALKQIDFTLTIAPNSGLAYLVRAQARHNLGDATAACQDLKKAVELGMVVSEDQKRAYCK